MIPIYGEVPELSSKESLSFLLAQSASRLYFVSSVSLLEEAYLVEKIDDYFSALVMGFFREEAGAIMKSWMSRWLVMGRKIISSTLLGSSGWSKN